MSAFFNFLRCLGRVVVKTGARALARLVPFGETAFEIARDAQEEFRRDHTEAELRAELEGLVHASPAEVRQAAEKVAACEARGLPAEVSLTLVSYLDQVPATVGQLGFLPRAEPEFSAAKETLPKDPSVTIKSPKRTYTLLSPLGIGDVADVHFARGGSDPRTVAETYYALKIARNPEGQALLNNERWALNDLLSAADDTTYRKYMPTLAECFTVKDPLPKRVNVFLYETGLFTLEQVHARHPVLDARHLAWIGKRLLTVLGFCHSQGKVHGAVLPCHVLIHAAHHGLQLVGWGQSVEIGRPIRTLSPRYESWYPPEVRKKRPAAPPTDLFLAARCLIYLAGGDPVSDRMPDTVPAPMQRFIDTCLFPGLRMRPDDAWKLQDEFDALLCRLYGPPKFLPLTMT